MMTTTITVGSVGDECQHDKVRHLIKLDEIRFEGGKRSLGVHCPDCDFTIYQARASVAVRDASH